MTRVSAHHQTLCWGIRVASRRCGTMRSTIPVFCSATLALKRHCRTSIRYSAARFRVACQRTRKTLRISEFPQVEHWRIRPSSFNHDSKRQSQLPARWPLSTASTTATVIKRNFLILHIPAPFRRNTVNRCCPDPVWNSRASRGRFNRMFAVCPGSLRVS
jgi:hypothetical protein